MDRKTKRIITKILVFILVWFVSMLVFGIIGGFIHQGDTIPGLFGILYLLAPFVLATLAVLPRKRQKASTQLPIEPPSSPNQPFVSISPLGNSSKSVYCTNCGNLISDIDAFCAHCGARSFSVPTKETDTTIAANEASGPHLAKTYRITGLEHYKDNILNLAIENEDYTKTKRALIDDMMTEERIWKYNFYPTKVSLVPEPENPYDPNAIKVIVDNEHVGYIKKGSCKHLLKLIAEGRLGDIDCTIGGGPYKYIHEDYDDDGNDKYELERDEVGYSVILTIIEHEA